MNKNNENSMKLAYGVPTGWAVRMLSYGIYDTGPFTNDAARASLELEESMCGLMKTPPIATYNNVLATDVTPNPVRGGGPVEPVRLGCLLCEGSHVLLAMHGEDPKKPEETAAFRRACGALGLDYLVIPSVMEKGLDYNAYTNDSELAQIVGNEILATDEKEYAAHIDDQQKDDQKLVAVATQNMYDKWGELHIRGVGKWLKGRVKRHIPVARICAEFVLPARIPANFEAFRPLAEAGLMELSGDAGEGYEAVLSELDQIAEAAGWDDEGKEAARKHVLEVIAKLKGKPASGEITDAGAAEGLFWGRDKGNEKGLFCTAEAYPRIMKLLPAGWAWE